MRSHVVPVCRECRADPLADRTICTSREIDDMATVAEASVQLPANIQAQLDELAQYRAAEEKRKATAELERRRAEATEGVALPSGGKIKVSDGGKIAIHPPADGTRKTYPSWSIRPEDLETLAAEDWQAVLDFAASHVKFTMTKAAYIALRENGKK